MNASVECSLIREMKVEEGTREDWNKLSGFHYRGHKVSVPRKIFRLVRERGDLRSYSVQLSTARLLWKTLNASANDNSRDQ